MRDFLYTLILLGSLQGVIVCGLLLFSRGRLLSSRFLAGIIGLMTLPGFHLYFHYVGGYDINAFTTVVHDIMPMVVVMPIGPLVYFYVRSLTEPGFQLGKKQALHFLPVIIDLLPKMAGLVLHISILTGMPIAARTELVTVDDIYNRYADIPRWISLSSYLVLTLRYLRTVQRTGVLAKLSPWLRVFTSVFSVFQLIWLVYLVPYIIPATSDALLRMVDWFPIYIPMTILVYWLGIQGYLTSVQTTLPKKQALQGQSVDSAWAILRKSMDHDRLYLDPALNLEKLAGHTGLTTRQISELLNQHRSTNFSSFINHYRVEEFKMRVMEPDAEQFTMAGLAMKCGFNSPASFQRIFKQSTGMSPSLFQKQQAGHQLKING